MPSIAVIGHFNLPKIASWDNVHVETLKVATSTQLPKISKMLIFSNRSLDQEQKENGNEYLI